MNILVAWLGNSDLTASSSDDTESPGPLLSAIRAYRFDSVHLLSDHKQGVSTSFTTWLTKHSDVLVDVHSVKLSSPTDYKEIYLQASKLLDKIRRELPGAAITLHLSP